MKKQKSIAPEFLDLEDRTTWGDGPWVNEPDNEVFEYKGFTCVVQRGPMGAWNGYVQVPKDCPLIQEGDYMEWNIECHGGVTFGQTDLTSGDMIVGFDCAHYNDLVPMMQAQREYLKRTNETYAEIEARYSTIFKPELKYRTIEFAKNECKSIVDQVLASMGK